MKIDQKVFLEGIQGMEEERRVSRDVVLQIIKDAISKAIIKSLGGSIEGLKDPEIRVDIDLDKGELNAAIVKTVKEEVEDDFTEVELEEVNENGGKYKDGDEYLIPVELDDLRRAVMMSIKSMSKQKLSQVEKEALTEEFKGKIHTIVTGRIEAIDERGATVNIGRNQVYLTRKQMIGNETFAIHDPIKVYISDVATGKAGAHIIVSRSSAGFLEKLFEEEVHDIYDKTIQIKGIAREAGFRSKIAVYSDDPTIDPCGSCIGTSGSKIGKIVNQLGNGSYKEKIDVIAYSEIPGLYIAEALKPARVVGVDVDEKNHNSLVVVKDDSYLLAIGKKGINSKLAAKLTGYSIDIVIESEALEEGFTYDTIEELQARDMELRAQRRATLPTPEATPVTTVIPGLPEGYVAPQERVYKDEKNDFDEVIEEAVEDEADNETITSKEEAPVTPAPTKTTKTVKTTTTLESLEKALEAETKEVKKPKYNKKAKEEKKEDKEEEVVVTKVSPEQRMAIFTDEEIKAMEEEEAEEENNVEEEEVNYDDYDDYYDK